LSLLPGTRLGSYEILALLGAGGMGQVYRARDTRLGREVAIKVLPADLANDPEALSRLEREARAVAQLSHPNILAIHDFGRQGETTYAVMELLEGETLRERLEQGAPTRKAIDFAVQIAEGLAAAHEKGIVHRDLKPENIFVTGDGRVKLLDFGLAKRADPAAGPTSGLLTAEQYTEPGTTLGTVRYMSPEQVRGESVDHRSDIFSFGAVLYEMLTGRQAFGRETSAESMTAILKEDPPEIATKGSGPSPALQRIVRHCLEKKPGERFQSARDIAFALESALGDSGHEEPRHGAPSRWKTRSLLAGVAGVLILLLLVGLVWALRKRPEQTSAVAIRLLTYSGHDTSPAVSPDGKTIAFTSDRDGQPRVWLKQFKGGGEAAITAGPDDFPRFSPDGTSVLFIHTEGGSTSLHRITLLGNDPHKVVENAEQADWSPDGKQIAFIRLHRQPDKILSALFLIDAAGGVERELARFAGELVGFPRWSPDGRSIILNTPPLITSGVLRKLFLVDVKDGSFREIRPESLGMLSAAAWVSSEEIVFLQSESITGGGTAVSPARAFRENIRTRRHQALFWVGSSGTTLDLLPDGRVVFDSMSGRQNLREYALDKLSTPRWITHGTINDRQPVFAPEGEWVVFSSNRSGNLDLWAISARTGVVRSITDDPADDWDPAFSPDGRSLLWSSNRSGNLEIWASNPDGTGAHQVTHDGEDAQNPTQTRDGRWILYSCANRKHPGLWKIHPDGSGAQLLAPGAVQIPQVSPDGAHATYMTTIRTVSILHVVGVEDGTDMTFAVFPEPRRKTSVFPGRARWTPDGKRVIFTGQDEKGLDGVFIQDFTPGKDTSPTRRPLAGFDPDWITESLGLSPDGKRLVLSESERVFSLMIAEGVQGLGRQKGNAK
jgi:eukaryotic-like serine/threonine-protein kinase